MLLSVSYHIFGAANISQRRVLLRFDMFGISAGLISIYLIGIYTAFICFQVCLNCIIINYNFSQEIAGLLERSLSFNGKNARRKFSTI